jgi:hypothetical protein
MRDATSLRCTSFLLPVSVVGRHFILLWLCLSVIGCTRSNAQITVDFSSPQPSPQTKKGLTVDDVIRMSKAGLSDDIIIQQVRKQAPHFDLSADQLIQLKSARVSDRVINAMIEPSNVGTQGPAKKEATPSASASDPSHENSSASEQQTKPQAASVEQVIPSATGEVNSASRTEASPHAEWVYSREEDPLRSVSFDQFILAGIYIKPPSVGDKPTLVQQYSTEGVRRGRREHYSAAPEDSKSHPPRLIVRCAGGKFKEGYLDVVTFVQHLEGAHSLKELPQAHIQMRVGDRKADEDFWEIGTNGRAVYFDGVQLTKLITGKLLGHPANPNALVHSTLLEVDDAYGTAIVMRFDMPPDASRLVGDCNLDWSWHGKKQQ